MSSKVLLILFSLFLLLLYGNCQEPTTTTTLPIESVVTIGNFDARLKDVASPNQDGTEERLYSFDDIVKEMEKLTQDYLEEIIQMRNLVKNSPMLDYEPFDGGDIDPVRRRRRRRSAQENYVPDFIRDGIKLINSIQPIEGRLCSGRGAVIDFQVARFNHHDYVLCLTKAGDGSFHLHHGHPSTLEQSQPLTTLSAPRRLLSFRSTKSGIEELIVVVLNVKQRLDEPAVQWLQIAPNGQITYQHAFKDISRVTPDAAAVWPRHNVLALYDIYQRKLKLYKFIGTYFDQELSIAVPDGLSSTCAFTFNGVSYIVLGFGTPPPQQSHSPRDVLVYRYSEFASKLSRIQSIQMVGSVVDIKYFNIGFGTNQENFLVVVEQNHTTFYKFLKSKHEFLLFQRLESQNVRMVLPYGDHERTFVMAMVLESNDVFFITYNSLRFIYSNINIRIYALPSQPLHLARLLSSPDRSAPVVQLMIGGHDGVRMNNITFYHDNNLMLLWTEHLNWCRAKRQDVIGLERKSTTIEDRYSESFLKNEPLVIKGRLDVPSYRGQVVAEGYRQAAGPHVKVELDRNYFRELASIEQVIGQINQDIGRGQAQLNDAVLLNSNQPQILTGNYSFDSLRTMRFDGNHRAMAIAAAPLGLFTDVMNGQNVRNLHNEVVEVRRPVHMKVLKPINFAFVDMRPAASFRLNGLVNGRYNLSDIVTADVDRVIGGRKMVSHSLMVEERLIASKVNDHLFDSSTVLLTTGDQVIHNPVVFAHPGRMHTNQLLAKYINGIEMNTFFANVVLKNQPVRLTMPIEFRQGLDVYDLRVEMGSLLNGENILHLPEEVVWLNRPGQVLEANYKFGANVTIDGNLEVKRLNSMRIPEDLILPNVGGGNFIEGRKYFADPVFISKLTVKETLNDLEVIKGIPNILLTHIPQTITGRKKFDVLKIEGNSTIGRTINGIDIVALDQQSRRRPTVVQFPRIVVDGFASFHEGVRFDRLNTLTANQLNRLLADSMRLSEPWAPGTFDRIQFETIQASDLDCTRVNGVDLAADMLTTTTNQTIRARYRFNKPLVLEANTVMQSVNNLTLSYLDNLLLKTGAQVVPTQKVFAGNLHVHNIQAARINGVPFGEFVFAHDKARLILGQKTILGPWTVDSLDVGDLNVARINQHSVEHLLKTTLRKHAPQRLPNSMGFKKLLIHGGDDFACPQVNTVNISFLHDDVVRMQNEGRAQFVPGKKKFSGRVRFGAIEFERHWNNIIDWEMRHNWMVQNVQQNVYADFSINVLKVRGKVLIHDARLNNIHLGWLENNVVRLDRKSVIMSRLQFAGRTEVRAGDILFNGKLNGIDLARDVVLANAYGPQTLRGNINVATPGGGGGVLIEQNFDVNGYVNDVDVNNLCSSMFRVDRHRGRPLTIVGNVSMLAPVKIEVINDITYHELAHGTLRYDRAEQSLVGKKMIDRLVINGPLVVRRHVNNLNLENIFSYYLSITRPQDIDVDIVLNADQQVAGDWVVQREMIVEEGVISGVNIPAIDRYALRLYGDQQYNGTIHIQAPVRLDLHLNARWINGHETNRWMSRRRSVNIFEEETIFTESINIRHVANLVANRKLGEVDVNQMFRYAVLRTGGRNYTINGAKSLRNVEVMMLHTRPINKVTFSRENLLLRDFDQQITAPLVIEQDVIVNNTLIATKINDIEPNALVRRLVTKTGANVVHGPVRIKKLIVNVTEVHGLIDGIDISLLNKLTSRVEAMKRAERQAASTRDHFETVQSKTTELAGRLMFYEHFETITAPSLRLFHLNQPLLVTQYAGKLYLFIVEPQDQDSCYPVSIFSRSIDAKSDAAWPSPPNRIFAPGEPLSIHRLGVHFLLSSFLSNQGAEQIGKCLAKSSATKLVSEQTVQPKGSVFVQAFRSVATQQPRESILLDKVLAFDSIATNVKTALIEGSPRTEWHHLAMGGDRFVHLKCLNCPAYHEFTLPIEGIVLKIYGHGGRLAVISQKGGGRGVSSRLGGYLVTIFELSPQSGTKLMSLPMLAPTDLLMVDVEHVSNVTSPANHLHATSIVPYNSYLLVSEGKLPGVDYRPAVHVFGFEVASGTYVKVQKLAEEGVHSMSVIHPSPTSSAYVLLQKWHTIVVYRLEGAQGLQRALTLEAGEPINWMAPTVGRGRQHLLAMFHGGVADCAHRPQSTTIIGTPAKLVLLAPKYRQEVLVKQDVKGVTKVTKEVILI